MLPYVRSLRFCFLMLIPLFAVAGFFAVRPAVAGAAYPERPIKMVVPWAAGGDTDAIHRVIAGSMEKQLGKPVVVVNIAGASGTVGARDVMKAAPDGYTILAIHDFIHTTYHTGVAELTYRDFEPICPFDLDPFGLRGLRQGPLEQHERAD